MVPQDYLKHPSLAKIVCFINRSTFSITQSIAKDDFADASNWPLSEVNFYPLDTPEETPVSSVVS
jgi:hypothetical protein